MPYVSERYIDNEKKKNDNDIWSSNHFEVA